METDDKTTVDDIADYFIAFFHEHGDVITNLKLQKFLYFAQGWHLALYDAPLFNEDFEAWIHGPVLPDVYQKFKSFKYNPITRDCLDFPKLKQQIKEHLDEVIDEYGDHHAFVLEKLAHETKPWKQARGNIAPDVPSTSIILKEDMKNYFKTKLDCNGQESSKNS